MRTIRENGFLGAMLLAGCMLLFCGSAITAASKKAETEAAVETTETKVSESWSNFYSPKSSYSRDSVEEDTTWKDSRDNGRGTVLEDSCDEEDSVLNDSYDEGYDSVYEDDDYDLDRYDRDQDYADGVDDAISDYEEEYDEVW